ncbi:acyl-phosphate glycerol 3-phosphate acyltransferase [Sinomonas humi]|uniref:Acyl-phosphate glycerol 3-phosphate acyltransferase n=1 Tax=Sinomonas humi TaxID=1338436 RepID=A0A0B2AAC4_9MICC|nr:acyl-phosphate glycerol 3-phosphate acyltransferase [Sinomonas humi]
MAFAFAGAVVRPIMNAIMGKTWLKTDRLPDGGFIACPNHCTEIDPLVVGHMLYNLGRPPHFLAKAGLFKPPVLGRVMKGTKQIPVDRSGAGAGTSLEVAREVLDEGGAILIYPEGTLTRDPDLWPMKGHTGAARLALKTGAPVVPIAHWGAQEVFPRYAKRFHVWPRKRVRVIVGEPVDLSEFEGRPLDKSTLVAATEKIMGAITALLAELRGEEPPARRWDPSAHQQSLHGRDVARGTNPSKGAAANDGGIPA